MKALFFAFLLLTLTACIENKYKITGTMPAESYNGEKIYLKEAYNRHAKDIDSAVVVNRTFSMTGTPDLVNIYNIYTKSTKSDAPFVSVNLILERGDIRINIRPYNERASTTSGTPLNDKLQEGITYWENSRKKNQERWEQAEKEGSDEALKKAREETEKQVSELKKVSKERILANKDNLLSAYFLYDMMHFELDKPEIDSLTSLLTYQEWKTNTFFNEVYPKKEAQWNTRAGERFVDFDIELSDGTKGKFSDYVGKGKYILVDFWATWCGPCRQETPNLKANYEKYKNEQFDIISIGIWDNKEKLFVVGKEEKLPWIQAVDPNAEQMESIRSAKAYGINSIPNLILFNPEGVIIDRENVRGAALGIRLKEIFGK